MYFHTKYAMDLKTSFSVDLLKNSKQKLECLAKEKECLPVSVWKGKSEQ